VHCFAPTKKSGDQRPISIIMATSNGSTVSDIDDNPTIGGGVRDVYGEDRATEDQFVTPWSVSVARCVSRLVNCNHNHPYRVVVRQ
jgi:malate dehydrogenase (oxaloacetate-decarboxylating)(NADP+)